ncbi:MAG: GAF domain-containing protein [Armatimonadetes bacterium]|nr:GAF domain-containing protein [Armatimonadota bacterium]
MATGANGTPLDFWKLFSTSWDHEAEGLEATLQKMIQGCAEWFQASGASLFLEKNLREFTLAAKSGADSTVPDDAVVFRGEGIAGKSIEEGLPMLLQAVHSKNRKQVGSSMVVPLMASESDCIGVLNLARNPDQEKFSREDLAKADSFGRYIALAVANARLVAEATRANNEIRRAQSMLQEVIQCLGVAVIVVDSDLEVVQANPEAMRLLGAMATKPQSEAFHGLMDHVKEHLAKCIGSHGIRSRYADETTDRQWSVVCAPMGGGGATAAIEEVTSHVHTLRELSRMNRLAEIGQMTAAIAHEIRNPLTSIRSAASLLRSSPDQAEVISEIIEEETTKLNGLCDEFLEFARPMVLRLQEVDLAEICSRLVHRQMPHFKQAKVGLSLEIKAKEPKIYGDSVKIEQVILNLLLNALQACKEGDRVHLRVDENSVTIEDTGAGMDEEQQQRLFTPFFTTKAKGTGLGLCNVRKIVDAHGGAISVRSAPGNGAAFEVSFSEKAA